MFGPLARYNLMAKFLQQRRRESEWMDVPDADPATLAKSLSFIRIVNRFLGYTRATLYHLERFSRDWKPGERIRILDVATGSGDIPREIIRWANHRGFDLQIVAIDLHQQTLVTARSLCESKRIKFLRADATHLPFDAASFDYVLTSMFLHHLDEPVAIDVLRELDRVALRGVIVADLLRSRRAYAWITLFTLLANPMVKHDARVSVSGAFSEAELLELRDKAGIGYLKPRRHFGHRLVLAGRRADLR
jgi:2-polyprenyl-3-methyl-5-hydroxy-6-metoxy-1,4-benzoquinol methylase